MRMQWRAAANSLHAHWTLLPNKGRKEDFMTTEKNPDQAIQISAYWEKNKGIWSLTRQEDEGLLCGHIKILYVESIHHQNHKYSNFSAGGILSN